MGASAWLSRLKNGCAPETEPRKPRKPDADPPAEGFLGFLGTETEAQPKTRAPQVERASLDAVRATEPAANDSGEPGYGMERMTQAEAAAFAERVRRFTERGLMLTEVDSLATRLLQRDRDCDDRRMCLECSYLGTKGRCIAAATGRLIGASRALEPVPDLLQRCEGFGRRKGLA